MISRDNGFEEAVGLVADATRSAQRLSAATGFQVVHEGAVAPEALKLMGIGRNVSGSEILLRHPDAGRGAIRLISLEPGLAAPLMRDGGQAWDHGGIFDINIRALTDLEDVHARFGAAGFSSPAPVTDWDFGSLGVREVVERDADGICIAAMQRVHPPLQGYEGIGGPVSWVFNSTQIVPDFGAARALFVDGLGWKPVQETTGFAAGEDGANCMGFPLGLAPQVPMQIGIYHPHGRMEGSVEIIAFGCGGRDFTRFGPPRRGWAALRFALTDRNAMTARLVAAGCTVSETVTFDWRPHGRVRANALTTPWGARFELLETA